MATCDLEHLVAQLAADGFQFFTQAEVPSGDGGLSLGQALVAAHKGRHGRLLEW